MLVCVCLLQLLLAFSAHEALDRLRYTLQHHDVNWQHVLTLTATLLVVYDDAAEALTG